MDNINEIVSEHGFTRRSFLALGGAISAAAAGMPLTGAADFSNPQGAADLSNPLLKEAIAKLVYLTPQEKAYILDKGKAGVAKLPEEELRKIGLTPDTWKLEILADPAGGSVIERSFTGDNALDWSAFMKLAEKHAVHFLHVTNCSNGSDPYHMALWEGVPLREIVWMAGPKDSIRRVYYDSYVPAGQPTFRSSLPMGMVLETPPGEAPPVLAYKMNGQPIPAALGGPVRMIVPGSYGSRAIKWLTRIVFTNVFQANDTDSEQRFNNDPDNAQKTRARFINPPKEAPANQPFALTGLVQIGVSGLVKVQYALSSQAQPWPADDPYRTKADWKDAQLLPPPTDWGGGLPGGKLPAGTIGIDSVKGAPLQWPMRYTIAHWAALAPGLSAGSYDIVCRTIDQNGIAQPMPRPLLRTGYNVIQVAKLVVN